MTDDEEAQEVKPRKSLKQMQVDAMLNEGSNEGSSAWNCPSCQCRDFRVTNTWYLGENKKRLRICRNCGTPVTTCEIPVPDGYSIKIEKTV